MTDDPFPILSTLTFNVDDFYPKYDDPYLGQDNTKQPPFPPTNPTNNRQTHTLNTHHTPVFWGTGWGAVLGGPPPGVHPRMHPPPSHSTHSTTHHAAPPRVGLPRHPCQVHHRDPSNRPKRTRWTSSMKQKNLPLKLPKQRKEKNLMSWWCHYQTHNQWPLYQCHPSSNTSVILTNNIISSIFWLARVRAPPALGPQRAGSGAHALLASRTNCRQLASYTM